MWKTSRRGAVDYAHLSVFTTTLKLNCGVSISIETFYMRGNVKINTTNNT